MFKLGVITDEVSQSLSIAIEFAKDFRLDGVELRSVNEKCPFQWSEDDVFKLASQIKEAGLEVCAISAPLFKCDISDEKAIAEHIEGFRRCAEFSKILGCRIVRGFDFWSTGASLTERAKRYIPIIEICREHGIICAMEYDPSVHSSTAPLLRQLIDEINSPYVRAVFDPGNGVFSRPSEAPIPHDYNAMKSVLCHIHVKDAVARGSSVEAVKVGTGNVDYRQLLTLLRNDGYSGYLVLETHYRKGAALTDEQLMLPGGADFSDGAYPASYESMKALKGIINSL